MRPSKPPSPQRGEGGWGKRGLAAVLLLAGLAYLVYKHPYLALDAPDALKALIVAPGAVLLVAASFVGFPDARRRTGGALLALGFVALLWTALEPLPNGGWTFYTPYSSLYAERPLWLKGPEPVLAAATTLLPLLGIAVLRRASIPGGLLLGAALWCALCFAPSRGIAGTSGMPRRYAYYYASGDRPLAWDRSDVVLPILLGLAGAGLTSKNAKHS